MRLAAIAADTYILPAAARVWRVYSRAWSRAKYATYPAVEGFWYRSKMHGGTSVALYERAAGALSAAPVYHEAIASPRLFDALRAVAHDLGYDLV